LTVIIEKNIDKKEFEKILTAFKENKNSKEVNTSKHCGFIKLNKDSFIIQKEMRDEWV
jgi:hypothetical protein